MSSNCKSYCASLLPLLGLFVCSGSAAQVTEEGPRSTVDVGHVEIGSVVKHTFPLRYTGKVPLEIKAVTISCKCLLVDSCPPHIVPNVEGRLDVRLVPDTPGDFAYETIVHFKDSSIAPWIFLVFVSVPPTDEHLRLYSSVTDVRRKLAQPAAPTLVDLRSDVLFSRARIAHSLNLSARTIQYKGWLKDRDIVLVDDGAGSGATEALCKQLREGGFSSVVIMRGGLAAWLKAGGVLDGDAAAIATGTRVQLALAVDMQVSAGGIRRPRQRVRYSDGKRRRGCGGCP